MTSSVQTAGSVTYNGHSMVGSLQRVLVCSPRTAGWGTERASCWHELGFRHAPQVELAQAQHETLCDELMKSGVEVLQMQACDGISIDAVYAHDASLLTDYGVIL